MKRIIAFLTAVLMAMSMTACNSNENSSSNNEPTTNVATAPTTVGEKLLADFRANSTGTAQEIADR